MFIIKTPSKTFECEEFFATEIADALKNSNKSAYRALFLPALKIEHYTTPHKSF